MSADLNLDEYAQPPLAPTPLPPAAQASPHVCARSCWIAEKRTASGELTYDLTRFPHGMKWLADQAHSRQLKLGLYAAASIETCRQFPGSQGYEEVDAKTFAGWGADFAKLDSCGGDLPNGTESWYQQYGRWSDAMNKTGRQCDAEPCPTNTTTRR